MSTHPNAILQLTLSPHDLPRKTHQAIVADCGASDYARSEGDVKIGDEEYHTILMQSDYDEGHQISAKEGDIVVYYLITYGYGAQIAWPKLQAQKDALEEWAKAVCEKHKCDYSIFITANYW